MANSGSWNTSWESKWWAQTYNTKYYHWRGNWSKSGNTITLSNMAIYMSFAYVSGGNGVTDNVTVTGGSKQTITYPTFNNTYATSEVALNNTSFSVGSSATSYTISCAIDDEITGYVTIYFDPVYVKPTKPTNSASVNGPTQVTVTFGTTSFGTPATGTITLYGGTTANPTTVLATETTTGNHTFTHTNLAPGTTYYYRARAYNGQLNSDYSDEISITTDDIILYGSVNGQTKRIMKLYGAAPSLTVVSGTIDSGDIFTSFNATNLESHAVQDLGDDLTSAITKIRASYTASTQTFAIDVDLADGSTINKYNGPLNSSVLLIGTRLGCSIDGDIITNPPSSDLSDYVEIISNLSSVTKEIIKLYGSVNGQTKRIY